MLVVHATFDPYIMYIAPDKSYREKYFLFLRENIFDTHKYKHQGEVLLMSTHTYVFMEK